jgi:DNA-binding transcriptional MerR regulator
LSSLQKGVVLVSKQDESLYTIGEICEELNESGYKDFHSHNLRYLEKVLNDVFEIRRDEYLNRVYTKSDLDKLSTILRLKDQGLNYGAIKSMMVHMQDNENDNSDSIVNKECASDIEIIEEKGIDVSNYSIENLKKLMTDIINISIEETLVPKIDDLKYNLKKELIDIKIQNVDLKISLEKQQQEHYHHIDAKLSKWREESKKKAVPWYKQLFK